MTGVLRRLRTAGILSMNRRNLDYIQRHNPRRLYPLVDDKLITRERAIANGIAVPETFAVIETEHQNRKLGELLEAHGDFVIKPAHGSGGNGILVIHERIGQGKRTSYMRGDGRPLRIDALRFHVSNILSGLYSLSGSSDRAIIEYRVKPDPLFKHISFRGIPDIRMVVYKGVPLMAMLRLPTSGSGGKANLHQGAIGVGVDMFSGITAHGVHYERPAQRHPDTGYPLAGLQLPDWETLLLLAARCHDFTELGYLGVDVVLDPTHGPLLLELNARPGLSIQLANHCGLLHRLRAADNINPIPSNAAQRVTLGQKLVKQTD